MAKKYTIQEMRTFRNSYHRTSAETCREIFWEDIDKIGDTVSGFASLMRDQMFDKAVDGYEGWDNDEDRAHIKKELQQHIQKRNYVGAANFCMMLHGFKVKAATATGAKREKK